MKLPEDDNWKRALLPSDASVADAIKCLDESSLQIILVASSQGVLEGTITDGDIRRGLLKGLDLDSPVGKIITREPLVVSSLMSKSTIMDLMRVNRIRQLPEVDEERRIVGLHIWDDLLDLKKYSNIFLIMAGGKGSRLKPFTDKCPKPLLPVAGKPMMEHIIVRARKEGFERFVVAVHYLGSMIEEYFGDGEKWGVQIDYLREETPLGTAGALSLLRSRPTNDIVICNGDVLSDIRFGDLLEFHRRNEASATMAVRKYEWQHPFGVVLTSGEEIVGFQEKPISQSNINAGVYVLSPRAWDALRPGESCDMPTLFERLHRENERTIAYPMHEPWLDVGRESDYISAHNRLSTDSE